MTERNSEHVDRPFGGACRAHSVEARAAVHAAFALVGAP